jgi:hypothetical protein
VRFIEHIMSPPIQKLIAEKYGFRPGTVVDVQPILVKAVLAIVTTPIAR